MIKDLTVFLIDIYRYIFSFDRGVLSILTPGGACRYELTCSLYTKKMIKEFGVLKGLSLGIKRIWSCR